MGDYYNNLGTNASGYKWLLFGRPRQFSTNIRSSYFHASRRHHNNCSAWNSCYSGYAFSGSGAVPSGWTIPYGQISNYTSMPVQFSQLTGVTTADPVFDSVNCTNTSAAIKISPSSNPSAPYLVMVGNYTISSTAYNVLNTYAYPLYITGTAIPIMYVNGNVTVNGTITGTFSGNVTGNCSGSSGSCTGNAATATNATELNGQLASYYAAASSLPNQALNTTSDAVFDSVLCTNASAAIKIGVYGGATYLAMNGNYTIGSTVYNVLNTYGNPLYITGTANPIVYINGNLTVTGTISGSIAWNGGTITLLRVPTCRILPARQPNRA